MDDILKTLYHVELEETKSLSQNRETNSCSACENLLRALSDKQKALFFVYEAEHNAVCCEYEHIVYRAAFKTGFRLAQELLSKE